MPSFVAIDFETANERRDSACAVGLVKVIKNRVVAKEYRLINPLDDFRWFCIDCHGIRPKDVENEPSFDLVWPELEHMLEGADFLLAHNAPFDRAVLENTCDYFDMDPPDLPFECTLSLSRGLWADLENHQLSTVCDYLGIELDHHHALSDALGCANIAIQAARSGYRF